MFNLKEAIDSLPKAKCEICRKQFSVARLLHISKTDQRLSCLGCYYDEVDKKLKKYREALEFYAEGKHFDEQLNEVWKPGKIGYGDPDTIEVLDHGEVAREALDEEELDEEEKDHSGYPNSTRMLMSEALASLKSKMRTWWVDPVSIGHSISNKCNLYSAADMPSERGWTQVTDLPADKVLKALEVACEHFELIVTQRENFAEDAAENAIQFAVEAQAEIARLLEG